MSLQDALAIADKYVEYSGPEKVAAELEEVELEIDDLQCRLARFYPKTRFKDVRIGWKRRLKDHPYSQLIFKDKNPPDDFILMSRLCLLFDRERKLFNLLESLSALTSAEEIRRQAIPRKAVNIIKPYHVEVAERRRKYLERKRRHELQPKPEPIVKLEKRGLRAKPEPLKKVEKQRQKRKLEVQKGPDNDLKKVRLDREVDEELDAEMDERLEREMDEPVGPLERKLNREKEEPKPDQPMAEMSQEVDQPAHESERKGEIKVDADEGINHP